MMSVRTNDSISSPLHMTPDVPQGSHLGPLLFNLYMNDTHAVIKTSKFLLFADDMKIFNIFRTPRDADLLQTDIDSIFSWSILNGLDIHIKKCISASFTRSNQPFTHEYLINDSPLSKVNCVKDLGVLLDLRFEFKSHIHQVCSKASRSLCFLKRSTHSFSDHNAIITPYKSIILPHLLYCSPICSLYLKIQKSKIQSIHHFFFRYLPYKCRLPFNRFSLHNYHDHLLS